MLYCGALARVAIAAAAVVLAARCTAFRSGAEPLRTVLHPGSGQRDCLVVLLPGRGDGAEDFAARGFVADLRAALPAVDALAVGGLMGHIRAGTVLERLRADVLQPARRLGYRQVWLAGISAGGSAAILYDGRYPGEATGLVLLAPFLGEAKTVRQVAAAGGPRAWVPSAPDGEDFQQDLWRWAKGPGSGEAVGRVFLLFGANDRFAAGHRLLAGVLPTQQVFTAPGGHDWRTWRELWRAFLRSNALAPCVPPSQRRGEAPCSVAAASLRRSPICLVTRKARLTKRKPPTPSVTTRAG